MKGEEKEKMAQELIEKETVPALAALEKRLKDNSSQDYLVGDKLTAADVLWVDYVHSHALNPMLPEEKIEKSKALL